MEKIVFKTDGNSEGDAFYILEQTKVGGINYLLVTDSEADEDGEALILKDISKTGDSESIYEIVTDDVTLDAVAAVFNSLLEDITLDNREE
ncbi:MAG: DUF1292 domain-containing protein [Lachnospiraceae bacterium]|nr:DUF1292 domain-containing protein [Lachnospiraceae bacterium]